MRTGAHLPDCLHPVHAGHLPVHQNQRVGDRKSTRLNSSHLVISYAVFCLKKKKTLRHSPPSRPPPSATRIPSFLPRNFHFPLQQRALSLTYTSLVPCQASPSAALTSATLV